MTSSINYFHGSDLEQVEKIYHVPKDDIVNFSDNVNPLGISPNIKTELANNIDLISKYPDREYTTLRRKISEYTSAHLNSILVGNGTTELISLLIQVVRPKKALIIGPTYSEYEKEIFLTGGSTYYYPLKESLNFQVEVDELNRALSSDIDLLVICNPNNPTSSAISHKEMRCILDHCKELDIFVLIDETYVEFAENMADITAVPFSQYYSNLMILRGTSKFFAAPGLRLGYGICGNKAILTKMNEKKHPWAINALASLAGEIMLDDTEYIEKTRNLIHEERNLIYAALQECPNVKVYPPIANFILFQIMDESIPASLVFEKLIHMKMMVRDASSFPFLNSQFVRFCFKHPEQNRKLLTHLKEILITG